MIKFQDLKETELKFNARGKLADILNLSTLKDVLNQINDREYGLPIEIVNEQIRSGGRLFGSVEDCLVIRNQEHSEYFTYCLTLRKQGRIAMLTVYYYGYSLNTDKRDGYLNRHNSVGNFLLNAVSGYNENAYNLEYDYYAMLHRLIEESME